MTIATRASLLQKLKNVEDKESWQQFFDTYWKLIHTVALRAGLREAEAEDAVQETLIAVANKMPGFEYVPGRDSFKGWLLNVTRWKIANQFRKRQPKAQAKSSVTSAGSRTSEMERIPDPKTCVLDALWNAEWQKTVLKAALKRLKREVSPKHYEIFIRYVVREEPVEQVAKNAGVGTSQVYWVKHELSKKLKREITRLETKLI